MRKSHPLYILSAIIFIGLLTSCGPEKLDRGKAATLIKEFYAFPHVETAYLNVSNSRKLVKDGWGYLNMRNHTTLFHFHEMAMPYVIRPDSRGYSQSAMASAERVNVLVIANCRDLLEVTGIALDESAKTAKVEFTCRRMGLTPFGALLGHKDGDVLNFTVNMKLYDDGWRITDKKLENIKPEAYPYFNSKGEFIGFPDEGV